MRVEYGPQMEPIFIPEPEDLRPAEEQPIEEEEQENNHAR